MSATTRRPVLRSSTEKKSVEDYPLPKWDRDGNLVQAPKKPPKATAIEDVEEAVVKVPTVKEIEAIREEAYNEGFEQGYQNGLGQGIAEGKKQGQAEGHEIGKTEGLEEGRNTGKEEALAEERTKTDEKLQVLESASQALKEQLPKEQSEIEDALLSLSIRIARQVLQDELRLKPNHIASVVHAAVQSLPNPDEKITLLLNPQELDFVETFADSHWTLEGDESVSLGGCIVKSGFSYVDYTLEHRFENAVSHLIANLQEVDADKVTQPLSDDYLMRTESSESKADESVDDNSNEQPETDLSAPEAFETDSVSDESQSEITDSIDIEASNESIDQLEPPVTTAEDLEELNLKTEDVESTNLDSAPQNDIEEPESPSLDANLISEDESNQPDSIDSSLNDPTLEEGTPDEPDPTE